jgi:hypothetical protein
MINFSKLFEPIANKIMDCRHANKIISCVKCRKYAICPLIAKLREYELMEIRQNERILGHK